jgi:uncharacterized cupin superfamily protein
VSDDTNPVCRLDDAPEVTEGHAGWASTYKVLTPSMRKRGGSLGVCHMRIPPGHAAVPFHYHLREDEAFYVLAGRGVLRYGEELIDIGPGDCIACPAGTRIAHQIANPHDEDLVYLAMGPHDPHEVCGYPDSGKIFVRSERTVGYLKPADYMDGEPDRPRILDLIDRRSRE